MVKTAVQKAADNGQTALAQVITHALQRRSIVLVGMMGAGKSSVGRRLAARLGVPFVDADAEIEAAAGMTIAEIFAKHGEPYFRAAYHHMWEEPKKMDDLEIFRNAFISSGIDIDRLIARAQQDDVKKGLIDRTTDAVNRGAFGSPTFFVGTEMFFGKDQLRDVEDSIVEQTKPVSKTA